MRRMHSDTVTDLANAKRPALLDATNNNESMRLCYSICDGGRAVGSPSHALEPTGLTQMRLFNNADYWRSPSSRGERVAPFEKTNPEVAEIMSARSVNPRHVHQGTQC